MITREFDLTIRVPQQDYNDTGIKLVQNDQNVYYFNIRITDGINDIDYSQVERATITFKKRDGHVVQGNLVPADTGYTYKLGTNEIACPGKVMASIQLYGDHDERLTTARFAFEVVQDLINPSIVESTTEFDALTRAISLMEELEERLKDFPNTKVLGTYPTLADLLAAHPDGSGLDGGYFVVENGEFYIWNTVTNQWESLGTIKGPQGDQGPQGPKGDKGDKGDTGKSLEFNWNGTQLGVRVEGDATYQYVDLKAVDGNIELTANDIPYDEDTSVQGAIEELRQQTNTLDADVVAHKAEIATQELLGHVKIGQNLVIDSDGTLHAQASGGQKVARFVIGTSTAGWTEKDCVYLCDGTDDQEEIIQALNDLPATGGEVVILDGTYNITASINIPKDNVSLRGNGNVTILKRMYNSTSTNSGPTAGGLITLNEKSGCKIQGLQIDGNKATYTKFFNCGIYLVSSSNNTITRNTCNKNNYYSILIN